MLNPNDPVLEATPQVVAPRLVALPEPQADDAEPRFEDGLARALVVSSLLGFLAVFAMVTAAGVFLTNFGVVAALAVGAFTGAFAGIGFGAMLGGALHRAPHPERST